MTRLPKPASTLLPLPALVTALLLSACSGTDDMTVCGAWPQSWLLPDDLPRSSITALIVDDACTVTIAGYFNSSASSIADGPADGFVLRLTLNAAGEPEERWRYVLGTGGTDAVTALEALPPPATGLRFLGHTTGVVDGASALGKSDVVIGQLDDDGKLLQITQLGDERPNRPLRMFELANAGYLLVGNDDVYVPTNYVAAWEDPWIASVSVVGNAYQLDWLLRANSEPGDRYDAAWVPAERNAVLLARSTQSGGQSGLAVERRNPAGGLIWSTRISQSPIDGAVALAPVTSGPLQLFGSSYQGFGGPGGGDLFVADLDPVDGTLGTIRAFGTARDDWARAMVADGGLRYVLSEVLPDTPDTWQIRLTTLNTAGTVLAATTLYEGPVGTLYTGAVSGDVFLTVGGVQTANGQMRGWLRATPRTPATGG